MFRKQPQALSGADNLKLYLSEAVLPAMIYGCSAPPMPPDGHKAHLNHIAIRPEAYRSRFSKIVTPKSLGVFDKAVLAFVDTLPCEKLNLPNGDDETGFSFTVPAPGFNILHPSLPRPTNIQEVAPWVAALPLQTMTRALHVAFPEARNWDVTYVNGNDPDVSLWSTLVWRKTPPPSSLETFWIQPTDPLERCSVLFAIQPPWIMTPQDLKSFLRCTSLPPFNAWDPDANVPFSGAERVWGKLWDTCVRRRCHYWVLSTYWGWVFGAFTEGYTAGQILDMKSHDAKEPTILQCLVYHVASSMGLVAEAKLPQYLETVDQFEWNMDIPEPSRDAEIEYPDSGSEWDGIHDEPGFSAGVSQHGNNIALSAWGSEQEFCSRPMPLTALRIPGRRAPLRTFLRPEAATNVMQWQFRVSDEPPPYERSPSPALSEGGFSTASIFDSARRAGSELPEVKVVEGDTTTAFGGILKTIIEQGPDDERVG